MRRETSTRCWNQGRRTSIACARHRRMGCYAAGRLPDPRRDHRGRQDDPPRHASRRPRSPRRASGSAQLRRADGSRGRETSGWRRGTDLLARRSRRAEADRQPRARLGGSQRAGGSPRRFARHSARRQSLIRRRRRQYRCGTKSVLGERSYGNASTMFLTADDKHRQSQTTQSHRRAFLGAQLSGLVSRAF